MLAQRLHHGGFSDAQIAAVSFIAGQVGNNPFTQLAYLQNIAGRNRPPDFYRMGRMSFINRELFTGTPLRDTRRARLVRGTLRFSSGARIPIVIRNLSERGLGVSCRTAPPQVGETVVVTLPGSADLDGVVRWTQDTTCGIELTGVIDAEEIAAALQREQARLLEKSDWTVSTLHRIDAPRDTGPRRRIWGATPRPFPRHPGLDPRSIVPRVRCSGAGTTAPFA